MLSKRNKIQETIYNQYEGRTGLVYARVSGAKQESEGHGRESQEARCKKEMQSIGVHHERSFIDTFTGGGDFMNRPAMREMLAYIDANPHKKFMVVFDDLKRFARDTEFHFKLRTALKSRDVIPSCLNYKFDDSPEGRFVETVLAAQNELERLQNARQVIQKMKARLELGYWPFARKRGYNIVKDPVHGKIGAPNKDSKILKRALEDFARGDLPRRIDFCRFLLEHGFWKGKHPERYLDQAAVMLSDCFYMGDIEYQKWGVSRRKGHHEPIISGVTYENIQKRLNRPIATARVRRDITEDFPERGLVACICSAHMSAGWSKGRSKQYAYYFCTNRECPFYKKSVSATLIEKGFIRVLKKTRLKKEIGKVVAAIFERVWKQEITALNQNEMVLIRRAGELDKQIRDLTDMARKAPNDRLRSIYEKQIEQVANELEAEQAKSTEGSDLFVPYRTALDKSTKLIKSPYSVWKKMPLEEQHGLFFFIFDEKLHYDPKSGYRTAEIPTTARLFEDFVLTNSAYVDLTGFEPVTSSLQMRRSTN